MKSIFLPLLYMIYTDAYGNCLEEELEDHYDPNCGTAYVPEYGRIRQGAWIHEDYYPTLAVDPTDAALWTAGITANKIKLVKELKGSHDGGTPKVIPGYGNVKEFTVGYDFVATLKDRVYKENYLHYKTLTSQTKWHLAYMTQTQIHISGAPVSVSVKNAIPEDMDTLIEWEATVKWFEQFTPAPYTMPAGIF